MTLQTYIQEPQITLNPVMPVKVKRTQEIELPANQILRGDCVEVMNGLPEKSIDLIFADPPYNLQLRNHLYRPNMTRVDRVDDAWDRFESFATYDEFTERWLIACQRLLKDTGTIWVIGTYHNIYRVGRILMDLGFWILNDIVWQKSNPMPNFRGVRFTNANETVIWAQKKQGAKYTFNYHRMKQENGGPQMPSVWKFPICSGKERIRLDGEKAHSTQKPLALLNRIILASSNTNDIVLDPFFGTGTTGVAAKKWGRRWIGIELDETYVQVAQNRLDNTTVVDTVGSLFAEDLDKKPFRVPFSQLIELGLIKVGQDIFLDKTGDVAVVLPDGTIKVREYKGSIHRVGTLLIGAPCNGWIHWEYFDEIQQKRCSINILRHTAREMLTSPNKEEINNETNR